MFGTLLFLRHLMQSYTIMLIKIFLVTFITVENDDKHGEKRGVMWKTAILDLCATWHHPESFLIMMYFALVHLWSYLS